ncbi:MAG: acyl-CoA dehydrogenase family protein [Pseudomonadales bacterium]|nr:acyl-CoA dehydrogenase family protein [Pseudomonadales bacterium]MDP7360214.1 acyl-CoA dehydrogenase family protein [Pseudomonadales bacterium]MDP7596742.1 acyl-CoA dehydrogenase family protein [Pseudomonadales bacterium]HJN50294.1 acyl-CoA dehydrogenase family protein [Pseudomonadales bacterium]
MTNYYQDNTDIQFQLKKRDLTRVVSLVEDDFSDGKKYPHAPKDLDDALDNYERVLEIVGEISGDFVAPRARDVDATGAQYADGEVTYPKGLQEAIERINKADLSGFVLQRKYGGLNMPYTVFSAVIEIFARADASLPLIISLQALAATIEKFGSDEQKDRILPRFVSGEIVGSMALTEPDSGSDLQSIMLKASQRSDGKWQLNGVKRFITSGCEQLSLVMARSEEGSSGGRGISLFIYERDQDMRIRRIESKLGIKGSPTCELQFNNAQAELLGKRRMGLVKYTMYLMNSARLAIAAQAVGIAEAAYREANSYARDRNQFKKSIQDIPAVYEMLTNMRVNIEAARCLLYETSSMVDIKEGIERKIEMHPDSRADLKNDLSRYTKYASLCTPLIKRFGADMANQVCYDALQVHGGVGFTKEFDVERHYRDVRITSIYEGTSQLQVLGAVGGVVGGVIFERLNDYESDNDFSEVGELYDSAQKLRARLEAAVSHIKEKADADFQEYHSERLVNMATDTLLAYLLCIDALKSDRKKKIAQLFIAGAQIRVKSTQEFILADDVSMMEFHADIIKQEEVL